MYAPFMERGPAAAARARISALLAAAGPAAVWVAGSAAVWVAGSSCCVGAQQQALCRQASYTYWISRYMLMNIRRPIGIHSFNYKKIATKIIQNRSTIDFSQCAAYFSNLWMRMLSNCAGEHSMITR